LKYPTNPSHPIPRRSLAPLTGAKVKSRETYRVIHREAHVSRLRMSLDFVCYARLSTWTRACITYKLVRHMESTVERHMESTVERHMESTVERHVSVDSVRLSTPYLSTHGPEHNIQSRETYGVNSRVAYVSRLRMSLDFVCYARLSTWTRAYIQTRKTHRANSQERPGYVSRVRNCLHSVWCLLTIGSVCLVSRVRSRDTYVADYVT